MRLIKFKAVCKCHKRMHQRVTVYASGKVKAYGHLGNPDLEIMQFTGLFDKNGKEIYEGDILQTGSIGIAEVIFEKAAFRAKHKEYKVANVWPILNGMKMEVIGNIYENPELIK